MRFLFSFLMAFAWVAANRVHAGEVPAGWKIIQPVGARCCITVPDSIQKSATQPDTWIGTDANGQSYNLSFEDQAASGTAGNDLLNSTASAIAQSKNGTISNKKLFERYGFAACDFQLSLAGNKMALFRLVLVKRRSYLLEVDGTVTSFDPKQATIFFDSLRFYRPYSNRGK